jgi:hypothetical protein
MRHLGIIASSVPPPPPSVSVSSVTNFNQNIATFNGTVSANGSVTTTIKFQISTNNSTWSDATGGTTITNTSSNGVSVYYNATGLSIGTLYYVRLVATNAGGTVNSSSTSFTTWSLKTYRNGPSGANDTLTGSQTFTIPTVTPTGGTQVIPTVIHLLVVGGGGGSYSYSGGAGGGYRTASSRVFADTSTTTLSITIGAAGAAGNDAQTIDAGSGSSSTISAANFTSISATGGGGAVQTGNFPETARGGATPANDNSAFTGGLQTGGFDLKGSGFATAGGGGAGCAGNGSSGSTTGTSGSTTDWTGTGGNGGNGAYYAEGNFNVGPGGYGGAVAYNTATNGSLGSASGAISGVGPYGKGANGNAQQAGAIGVVHFKYYAA